MKVIWALFDDDNCSYKKAIEQYFDGQYKVYCIGINKPPFEDTENYKYRRINLSILNSKLFKELSKLPRPNIILASPPCERLNKFGDAVQIALITIIRHFSPELWLIENPTRSMCWKYQEEFLLFTGELNKTYYDNYNNKILLLMPITFKSNIHLNLKCKRLKNKITQKNTSWYDGSIIPLELIKEILLNIKKYE